MLQCQSEVLELPSYQVGTTTDLEFEYEPVFWSRTKVVLAYEQLARRPGGGNASFLQSLSDSQSAKLDFEALAVAINATRALGTPVLVNGFPQNVERMARELNTFPSHIRKQIGLEVNENLPITEFVKLVEKYPDIWWILDDLDQRKDSLETIAHPFVRRLPLTAKFNFQCSINNRENVFDMNVLPANWMIIVEGVKPSMLTTLTNRGISFVQGRDFGMQQRNVTGEILSI